MGYRTFDSAIDERKKKNAAIFRQTADCTMMEEEELKNKFKVITFSIIEDHNSGNVNLRPFQAEFGYQEQP